MAQLAGLCDHRLHARYGDKRRKAKELAAGRLQEELRIIEKLGLAGFFLLHHDMLELAREVAIEVRGGGGSDSPRALLPPGRGRGSSVSSIVCYLTGLSHVDPIANELMIGRFLNEELTSLPDIDLDFPRDIREVLIPRVHERYGRERSALVAAFPTYRARGAIRELGKALGLPPGEIERLARSSEGWDSRRVGEDIENTFGVSLEGEDPLAGHGVAGERRAGTGRAGRGAGRRGAGVRWRWLARLAVRGAWPATTPLPALRRDDRLDPAIDRLLPDRPGGDGGATDRPVGQGLLLGCGVPEDRPARPRDALGGRAVRRVDRTDSLRADRPQPDPLRRPRHLRVHPERRHDRRLSDREPSTDAVAATYATREPEGHHDPGGDRPTRADPGRRGQSLHRTPSRAPSRPRLQDPLSPPSLESVLRETLGTIIFQDQVLEVAIAFAGFSIGEAEGLRRAMSRKRSQAAIEAHHRRFVAGAQRLHGVDEETAERVFSMIQGFSGFGFPKAHGAAFGLLAYQSTWLRVHYGPEFLCSLLNEQPMGFYPARRARARGPAEGHRRARPRHQRERRRVPDGTRRGCGSGSGMSAACAARTREPSSAPARPAVDSATLGDLASRAGAGAPSLELLAWSGACDSLVAPARPHPRGGRRSGNSESAPQAAECREASSSHLRSTFPRRRGSGSCRDGSRCSPTTPRPASRSPNIRSGCSEIGCRPEAFAATSSSGLGHGRRVRVGGLVVARQRPGTAGGVVFVLLEDERGTINLIIPPATYERYRLLVRTEPLLLVDGRSGAVRGGRRRDQHPRRRRDCDLCARPHPRPDQGLLAARRAGPSRAGTGADGGFPSRRAGGDELRRRAAAMRARP